MKLNELQTKPKRLGESMLIYGNPKSGKTWKVGKLANDFNLLWFDLENGIKTLINDATLSEEAKSRIEVIQIPDTKANPVAIETMLRVFAGAPGSICEEHGKWNCLACKQKGGASVSVHLNSLGSDTIVVVDSLSQLSDSAYNQVMGPEIDAAKEWKHYDAWNQRVGMVLSFIQQAPYHTVFIGHASMLEQENGMEKMVPVGGTKRFSNNVAKYFGHVLFAEAKSSGFVVASQQKYAANILLGNRANLDSQAQNVELKHFFLPPSELPPAPKPAQSTNLLAKK